MQFMGKIKFRNRLLIAPVIAIVMMLLLGMATYFTISSIRGDIDNLTERSMKTMALANDARAELLQTNVAAYRLFSWMANFDEGRISKETALINAGIDKSAEKIKLAAELDGTTEEEKKSLEKMAANLAKYKKSLNQALDIAASDMASGVGMMQAADKRFQAISQEVNTLLEAQRGEADETVAMVQAKSARSNVITLVLIVIATVVSILMAWTVTQVVMKQLGGGAGVCRRSGGQDCQRRYDRQCGS